jgi:hypothetical protein
MALVCEVDVRQGLTRVHFPYQFNHFFKETAVLRFPYQFNHFLGK